MRLPERVRTQLTVHPTRPTARAAEARAAIHRDDHKRHCAPPETACPGRERAHTPEHKVCTAPRRFREHERLTVPSSLDTLDPFKFEIMTRRMGHDAVLRSLQTALASRELQSVKLNVVVVKGLNDHEVPDFVEMTKESRLSVRFIEFMPFTGAPMLRSDPPGTRQSDSLMMQATNGTRQRCCRLRSCSRVYENGTPQSARPPTNSTIPLVLTSYPDTLGVSDSSAACPTTFADRATD